MAEKHFACKIADVSPEQPVQISLNGKDYGIYQVKEHYYALRDRCPHRGGSLCRGPITGTAAVVDFGKGVPQFTYDRDKELVRCSWHGWEYDIKSGQCLADSRLKARKVETAREGEEIYLVL